MATNYTYVEYLGFHIIHTKASNIQLVSLNKQYGKDKYIRDTPYYGMNASFFTVATSEINNIAYQNGTYVGPGNQGYTNNGTGTSIICWNGSNLRLYDNVQNGSSSLVPKNAGSWAQGGVNLNLQNYENWEEKFLAQTNNDVDLLNKKTARTGILINEYTNDVFLFMTPALVATVKEFRSGMITFVNQGLESGGTGWQAILTDGGASAQMVCAGVDIQVLLKNRPVPQIIALKNKN